MKEDLKKRNGIVVDGHMGTWYVIDDKMIGETNLLLLEHEKYGDEVACVIVDEAGKLVLEDVWNGFDDLEHLDNDQERIGFTKDTEGLPDGWSWIHYEDGSGYLLSPQGEFYFSYDLAANEAKFGKSDTPWYHWDKGLNKLKEKARVWIEEFYSGIDNEECEL